VSCSFLALVLKEALQLSWPEILADLNSLTETAVEQDGKRFMLRSAPRPAASLALRAVGVVPSSTKCSAKPLFRRGFLCAFNGQPA
jgi:hypothetical protein